MKNALGSLVLVTILLFAVSTIAADKVVVVPLSSSRAAGVDGQIQYNDGGRAAGAEVYYDKAKEHIGIGTTTPSAKLEVKGEIRSTDSNGNNRLWGQGREVYIDPASSWTEAPNYSNIEYAYSQELATWYSAQSACPENTWVCSSGELRKTGVELSLIPSYTGYDCSHIASVPTDQAWVTSRVPGVPQRGSALAGTMGYAIEKCMARKVWCCREASAP